MAGTVVIFDFDRTIIDDDSDRWVVTEMGLTILFRELLDTMPWNSLMDRMMMELHSNGKTTNEIAECLGRAPLHLRIIAAIKSAHALGCDLKVVSDANQFFIETILKHHGILGCFSEIISNPTVVDEEGRLKIFPYHDFTSSPHGCNLCPFNMCKVESGVELNTNPELNQDLQALARCPATKVRTYKSFNYWGYKFRTESSEESYNTQNSGVVVEAKTQTFASMRDNIPIESVVTYYGVIKDIIELSFEGDRKVVLFDCEWVDTVKIKRDSFGFTLVDFTRPAKNVNPFVLPSQVQQVFYVPDPRDVPWMVPIVVKPRDIYDLNIDEATLQENIIMETSTNHALSFPSASNGGDFMED